MNRQIAVLSLLVGILLTGSASFAAPPVLEVSPTYIEFSAYEDGNNPSNQILSIWRGGGNGPLNWEVTEDCNWIVVEPTSGKSTGEVDDVNVIVDISGLTAGPYNCALTVSAPGATNSPQIVDVNLIMYSELHVPAEYGSIQAAINAAESGDTVIVWPGWYSNINLLGKNIIVRSTDPTNPSVVASTIICGPGGSVVTFSGTESSACVLSGFTITDGWSTGPDPYVCAGGGIYGNGTMATIQHNIISNNLAGDPPYWPYAGLGGGIYDCDGTIQYNIISENSVHCNEFSACGGGLYGCDGTIQYNIISGNLLSGFAGFGGLYGAGLSHCHGTIRNNIISNNFIESWGEIHHGGGMYNCDGIIQNNTIFGNESDSENRLGGGGLSHCDGTIRNCIIWGNDGDDEIHDSGADVTYSNIEGGYPGTGNIDADPLFADPCNGDYHLKSTAGRWDQNSESLVTDGVTSPCIDTGNPGCPLGDEPSDANNIRINMGAYGGTAEASKTPSGWEYIIADLNNNFVVSRHDLEIFVSYWLESGECIPSDLNRSGSVDFVDYAIFAQHWLYPPPPGEAGIEYEISACDMGLSATMELDETRFTVTVQGRYIYFEDTMTANCCPDELWLEMTLEDNLITIYEHEYLTMPCFCICDYPVTATLGPFEPGTYTLEVYEDFGGFIGSTTVTIE